MVDQEEDNKSYLHIEWADKTQFRNILHIENVFLVKDKKHLEISKVIKWL